MRDRTSRVILTVLICLYPCLVSAQQRSPHANPLAEKWLSERLSKGEPADLGSFGENERQIRASILRDLLLKAGKSAQENGLVLHIENVTILGSFNLSDIGMPYFLEFVKCDFKGDADFSRSTFYKGLRIDHVSFECPANFSDLNVVGNLLFRVVSTPKIRTIEK
jgi:hypothetical protein